MFKLYFTYLYISIYLFIYFLFIHLFICNLLLNECCTYYLRLPQLVPAFCGREWTLCKCRLLIIIIKCVKCVKCIV